MVDDESLEIEDDENLESFEELKFSDIFDQQFAHQEEIKAFYRTYFFEVVRILNPTVFNYLDREIFELFKKTNIIEILNPFNKCTFEWDDFEIISDTLPEPIKTLRIKLDEWQYKFNLIESKEEKWILHWVIKDVLDYWQSHRLAIKHRLFREFKIEKHKLAIDGSSRIIEYPDKNIDKQIINNVIIPPLAEHKYVPHLERRENYLKKTQKDLKSRIEERIENDEILKYSPSRKKKLFINSIVDKHEISLLDYVDKVEKIYLENQYAEIPQKTDLIRDVIWTASSLCENTTYYKISDKEIPRLTQEFKNSKFTFLDNTDETDEIGVLVGKENKNISIEKILDYHYYDKATVIRSVKKILNLIEIKSNKKLGRGKGVENSVEANILRTLGK